MDVASQIAALKYAIYICEMRKSGSLKKEAYIVACDDIKLFLEAAIERLECGEQMESISICQ